MSSTCVIFMPLVVCAYYWQQGFYWEKIGIYCQNNLVLNDSLAAELRG